MENDKHRPGGEEIGTLVHCWREGKMVRTLWKTAWQFLRKVSIELPDDSAIPLPDVYVKELKTGSSGPGLRHRRLLNSPPPLQQQHKPLKETQEWAEPELHMGKRENTHIAEGLGTPSSHEEQGRWLDNYKGSRHSQELGRVAQRGSSPICGHVVKTGRWCYCI